jgi:hypothetical protein
MDFLSSSRQVFTAVTLCLSMMLLSPISAHAATTSIAAGMELDGIPPAGAPSFVFNAAPSNSFSSDIQSWFDNYLVLSSTGDGSGDYNLFAKNRGSFTYFDDSTSSYGGSEGIFDLSAKVDADGNYVQGSGVVQITGAIEALGLTDPNTVLMSATVSDIVFDGETIGIEIDEIVCNAAIEDTCSGVAESIYFGLTKDMPEVSELGGKNYRSNMTSITTVPAPGAAWLLISGLCSFGFMAIRRKKAV